MSQSNASREGIQAESELSKIIPTIRATDPPEKVITAMEAICRYQIRSSDVEAFFNRRTPETYSIPHGIVNIGNSCWLGSSLCCVLSSAELRRDLSSQFANQLPRTTLSRTLDLLIKGQSVTHLLDALRTELILRVKQPQDVVSEILVEQRTGADVGEKISEILEALVNEFPLLKSKFEHQVISAERSASIMQAIYCRELSQNTDFGTSICMAIKDVANIGRNTNSTVTWAQYVFIEFPEREINRDFLYANITKWRVGQLTMDLMALIIFIPSEKHFIVIRKEEAEYIIINDDKPIVTMDEPAFSHLVVNGKIKIGETEVSAIVKVLHYSTVQGPDDHEVQSTA